MTYPQQYGQPQYTPPADPSYGYQPPAQYPPQQWQQPMPAQPGYPPQQYGQVPVGQYAPQPPAAPQHRGSLDSYFSQPSTGGGEGWKWDYVGRQYFGQVSRPLTDGDVQAIVDPVNKTIQRFNDGRVKEQLVVPVKNADGSEGRIFLKGKDRDDFAAAMHRAGHTGPAVPEAGSWIFAVFSREQAVKGVSSPRKVKDWTYLPPNTDPAVVQQLANQVMAQTPAQPQAPQYAQPPAQFVPPQPVPQYAPPVAAPMTQMANQVMTQVPQPVQMPGPIPPAGVGPTPMPVATQPPSQPQPAPPVGMPVAQGELTQDQAALFAAMLQGQQPQA